MSFRFFSISSGFSFPMIEHFRDHVVQLPQDAGQLLLAVRI